MAEVDSGSELRRTPLYELHKQLGARFTPFGGWDMPVQYSGLVDEHQCVRSAVGLFDVSHMGEVLVEGAGAEAYLQQLCCNDVSTLNVGQAQYSMLLNEQGGVVDDIIIYKMAADRFFLCVNAANTAKDVAWLEQHTQSDVQVRDVSAEYAQIAVQGPKAEELLELVARVERGAFASGTFPNFTFREVLLAGVAGEPQCLIARTGYTGEDGFEIFCAPDEAVALLQSLLEFGQALGVKPAGLGARDTLRLEACYPLHGHEISDDITPLEAGLAWVVKLDKGDFIGAEVLRRQKREGLQRQLIGVEVLEPGIVREGAKLYGGEREIGWVTSGTKPPTVNRAIGLAIVDTAYAALGTKFEAEVRGRRLSVAVIKRPFYKRSSAKK